MNLVLESSSIAASDVGNGEFRSVTPVVALHCSGADNRQWRRLGAVLGPQFAVIAPDLIGCGDASPWHGERPFTLMAEAARIVDLIEDLEAPVHLVGHSYGGAAALMVASLCPGRTVSLSLYEPSAFHTLKQLGEQGERELAEIEELSGMVSRKILDGAFHEAAATFIDYWCGNGAWEELRPQQRVDVIRWLPKAPLDFHALLDDDTPLKSYRRLAVPTLLLSGERTRAPSRLIVEELARHLPIRNVESIAEAGHMGPVTHADAVLERIAAHIHSCKADRPRRQRACALAA